MSPKYHPAISCWLQSHINVLHRTLASAPRSRPSPQVKLSHGGRRHDKNGTP
ncbi:hypothetical protein CCHR01_19159 [Colletotrichum chrysophilum]|uniref:Uncharacterized protein n=1 Tax=Colletotrichum chrysophilum TaxID=1836956 RepID=A0AAD8ZZ51_9PEZI|nr:hypothetical protein CCHR01_19159 [Colletotrichum chrysophilum]